MVKRETPPSAGAAAAVGLAGLASAMGIGRFAFTPLLPLMQAGHGLTLAQGGWLAGANYLGYLVGALASGLLASRPGANARWGLLAVALSTLAMGLTSQVAWWVGLRFVAGVASAFVLIGAAGWAMAWLATAGRPGRTGWVFAGVGVGIAAAGLAVLAAAANGIGAARIWLALGALAALVAAATWPHFGKAPPSAGAPGAAAVPAAAEAGAGRLVFAYGLFGLGYIVPATFLPAAARSLVDDPAVFGWTWPLFGAAAALSTVVVSLRLPQAAPRRVAAAGLWLMAAGVLAPALEMHIATLLFSALAVGGTFMVVTMACMQEARRLGGAAATRLMSGMTAAFALGQALGPLAVRAHGPAAQAIIAPSLAATVLLVLAALALQRRAAVATNDERTRHA